MKLNINQQTVELDDDYADDILLWALRDGLNLTGTKYGCGIGQCGACTVHINGEPARSCQTLVSIVTDAEIRTLEGLTAADGRLHPVQQAFIDAQAPQCGYCMSGQMMSAAALIDSNPSPSDEEIHTAMQGNLCRCGSYERVREAIKLAAGGGA